MARTLTHFPAFYYWIVRTANDPAAYDQLLDIAWKLALVFGCAFAAEWLIFRLIKRPVALLEARIRAGRTCAGADAGDGRSALLRRGCHRASRNGIGGISAWRAPGNRWSGCRSCWGGSLLELLPVLVFVGVATMLLGTGIGDLATTRLVILAVVNAYALSRGLICVVRALAGPFGLFRVRAETAAYIEIWARRIVTVAVSGIAFANVALLLGLHRAGYAALLRLVMLVVHLFVVVIILQCRRPGRRRHSRAGRPRGHRRPGCAIASPGCGIIWRSRSTSRCGRCGRSISATATRCCCNISSAPSRSC